MVVCAWQDHDRMMNIHSCSLSYLRYCRLLLDVKCSSRQWHAPTLLMRGAGRGGGGTGGEGKGEGGNAEHLRCGIMTGSLEVQVQVHVPTFLCHSLSLSPPLPRHYSEITSTSRITFIHVIGT